MFRTMTALDPKADTSLEDRLRRAWPPSGSGGRGLALREGRIVAGWMQRCRPLRRRRGEARGEDSDVS